MVRFIDISNWQGGINLPALLPNVDGVVYDEYKVTIERKKLWI
jgi:hypothetical protein